MVNNKQIILTILIVTCCLQTPFSQWAVKNVDEAGKSLHVIKFANDNLGFAMGNDGLILKTTDEGETWTPLEKRVDGTISDFEFISADTLVAVSTSFNGSTGVRRIYKSTDAGTSWQIKYEEAAADFNCIRFVNDTFGIASGSGGILNSYDGGASWQYSYALQDNGFDYGEVRRFDMVSDTLGFALGRGKTSGSPVRFYSFLLKTTDGGDMWEETGEFVSGMQEMDFIDATTGFLADDFYTYKTIDGGLSWDTVTNVIGVADFSIPSADNIVTVNRPGILTGDERSLFAISKSTDFGASWDGKLREGATLESVYFLSDSVGFVAGDYSIIMKTTTGGGEIVGDYPWHLFTSATYEVTINELNVYPNPTSDRVTIGSIDGGVWSYVVQTIDGRKVQKGIVEGKEIDLSHLGTGTYILSLQSGTRNSIGKVTKR